MPPPAPQPSDDSLRHDHPDRAPRRKRLDWRQEAAAEWDLLDGPDDEDEPDFVVTRSGHVCTQEERRRRGLTAFQDRRPLGLPSRLFARRLEAMSEQFTRNELLVNALVASGLPEEEAANHITDHGRALFATPLPGDDLIARDDNPASPLK